MRWLDGGGWVSAAWRGHLPGHIPVFIFNFFSHGSFYYLVEVINLHLQGFFPMVREGETLFLQTSEKTSEHSSWFLCNFPSIWVESKALSSTVC